MTDEKTPLTADLPEPVVQRRRGINVTLVWLVPILAVVIGLSLVIHAWLEAGPEITITFQSAEGLDPGKTLVKYKNVTIGRVTEVSLSPDRATVIATVELEKSAASFATQDTRFWVVRPRVGLGGVSGIGTLLSGAFIGADVGQSQERRSDFTGLEAPPTVTHGAPGKIFNLHADDLGSLDIGSPIYYRRIQVGRVSAYHLDPNGHGVTLQIFVEKPNDQFVTRSTRFWNASGVAVSLGADGLKVDTQSLATMVAGGVAFSDPMGPHDATPAAENDTYRLFNDRAAAMAPPDGDPQYVRMRFEHSPNGLAVDAPVKFLGVPLGKVVTINLDYDEKTQKFTTVVGAVLYPQRLDGAYEKLMAQAQAAAVRGDEQIPWLMGQLVKRGLRAQVSTGNLLTGQLYIALDFLPKAPKASYDMATKPLEIPTAPGNFDRLQEQLMDMVDKAQKIPLDNLGKHLDNVLTDLDQTLKQVNTGVLPEVKTTLQGAQQTLGSANQVLSPDAPLQQNLSTTLQALQRAARSLRVLTDQLSAHPESLLRGARPDPKPVQAAPAANDVPAQGGTP